MNIVFKKNNGGEKMPIHVDEQGLIELKNALLIF